jgi:DNA helicase-2/ATP-dependent DNA helicase PcrA
MRWLERCAIWCCEGWRTGDPNFLKIVREGARLFSETILTPEQSLEFQRSLLAALWARRNGAMLVHDWLEEVSTAILKGVLLAPAIGDEAETLKQFIERSSPGNDAEELTLDQFAGVGVQNARLNLSTLHSAKGREFRVVILFAMDQGRIPRNNAGAGEIREARRVFYVGFTRPKDELHIVYTSARPSSFVEEVRQRMGIVEK